MTDPATSTPPPDDDTLLNALRHTGLRLIQAVDFTLETTDPTPAELASLATAYDRTGRGIRRTIAFCRHLAQPTPGLTSDNPAKRAANGRHVIRTVEDAIDRNQDRADPGRLRAELYERVETTEFAEDLDHRPAEEIIAAILRDFGLANTPYAPPYPRRTPAQVAVIAARAAGHPVAPEASPEPSEPSTVEDFLAWDKARRRPAALGP